MADMERLTKRNDSGGITVEDLPAALKKLAELEDAEKQGRMILLPRKPGETVYTLGSQNGPVLEWIVRDVAVYTNDDVIFYLRSVDCKDNLNYFIREDIGHTVYFTREEAENALKTPVT